MLGDEVSSLLEDALPALGALLALVSLVALLLPYLNGSVIKALPSTCACLCRSLSRLCKPSKTRVGEMEEVVIGRMMQQKVSEMRKVCKLLTMLHILAFFQMFRASRTDDFRPSTRAQEAVMLVHQSMLLVVIFCPRIMNARTIDCFYFLEMLLQSLMVTPWTCDPQNLVPTILTGNAMVVLVCGVRRSLCGRGLPLLLIGNAIYAFCTCLTLYEQTHALMESNQFVRTAAQIVVTTQLLSTALLTVIAHSLEHGLMTMMHHSMQLQETKEVKNAASALLRSCCDVVVELDGHGIIQTCAEDLSSFLLRGPGRSLKGIALADIIVEGEDRQRFLEKLNGPQIFDDVGVAESIHVRTKDGNSNVLRLELLWFRFCRKNDMQRFLMGVREFSDNVNCRAMDGSHNRSSGDTQSTGQSTAYSYSLPETESASTVSGSDLAVVVVNATCPGLPIQDVTSGFQSQIGLPEKGSSFMDLLPEDHDFMDWVQDSLNRRMNGMRVRDRDVVLCMSQGHVRATCRVMDEAQADGVDLDRTYLLFYHVGKFHRHTPSTVPESVEEGYRIGL